VCRRSSSDGRGGGGKSQIKSYGDGKAPSSVTHSLLSLPHGIWSLVAPLFKMSRLVFSQHFFGENHAKFCKNKLLQILFYQDCMGKEWVMLSTISGRCIMSREPQIVSVNLPFACSQILHFVYFSSANITYCKVLSHYSRDVTYQTLPEQNKFNYSCTRRVW
jgi:hypothetical protein